MKTALVTGAAHNIGRAIAIHLAQQEYYVAVHYNSSEADAQEVLAEVQQYSPNSFLVQADLTVPTQVEQMISQIADQTGTLNVLVNTVGNFVYSPLQSTSVEQLNDVLNSNVRSMFLTITYALPLLKAAGEGRVVNFGSAAADQITARTQTAVYTAAKAAVISLTKSWAKELAQFGITVNAVSPGIVEGSSERSNHPLPELPLGQPAQIADIVNSVDFLLRAESGYVSGANIEVAGAWTP